MTKTNCWKSVRIASFVDSSKTIGGFGSFTAASSGTGLLILKYAVKHQKSSKSWKDHPQSHP